MVNVSVGRIARGCVVGVSMVAGVLCGVVITFVRACGLPPARVVSVGIFKIFFFFFFFFVEFCLKSE